MNRQTRMYMAIIVVASWIILLSVSLFLIYSKDILTMDIKKGDHYLDQGDYDKALLAYQKALDQNDEDVDAYLGMIRVYDKTGDYELLLKTLHMGLEKTGDPRIQALLSIYIAQEEAVASQGNEISGDETVPEPEEEEPEEEVEEEEESGVYGGDAGAVSFLDIESAGGEILVPKSSHSEEELMDMIGMQGGE